VSSEIIYKTDERLKKYLDSNQLDRERLCLAVMRLDRRFSDVRPRHPRGGPDGGRDIEARLNGVRQVFGAIGFVNQATDSNDNKRSAQEKFHSDLEEALKQKPRPEGFVFFTNINLTIGEKEALIQAAKSKGLLYADVFDRERIRIPLDSPDGFGIRVQYLGIPMSQEEQTSFFSRWGDDIQSLIGNGLGQIQQSLNRIHFLQEAALPLAYFGCELELDREYSCSEIGHFRAFAEVFLRNQPDAIAGMMFGSTDNRDRPKARSVSDLHDDSGICGGVSGGQWLKKWNSAAVESLAGIRRDLELELSMSSSGVGLTSIKAIHLQYSFDDLIRLKAAPNLRDIDECWILFILNQRLAEKVSAIHLYANEYKLAEIKAPGFRIDDTPFDPLVPFQYNSAELADPWVRLRPEVASAFSIRFSEQTPKRLFSTQEVGVAQVK
jgi:hypothetical protein